MGKTKTAFVSDIAEEKKPEHPKFEKHEHKTGEKVHIAGLKGGQRIKIVEAAPIEEAPAKEVEKTRGPERVVSKVEPRAERIRSKKYQEAKKKFDSSKIFPIKEAIKLAKETSYSKFDGSLELHLVVKKVGTNANITLPYSTGKAKKVEVASEETIKKLEAGKIDFDVLLATAEMMPKLVPFARILGPKGLMPNPKNGTLIKKASDAEKFTGNSLTLKTEKEAPLIHTVIGKVSQKDEELMANFEAIAKTLGGSKQIIRAFIKATMGPAVKIAISYF